jgi:Outer membrane protein beta-barrel domain
MQHTIKKLLLLVLIPFLTYAQETDKPEIINPKGNWYFGAEMGLNTITSFDLGEPNKSFQGGVLAEYYTGRHWSLCGRLKYFETGFSLGSRSTPGFLGSSGFIKVFNGKVISIPVDAKWQFEIRNNYRGYFKMGLAYNHETKSEYFFTDNVTPNYDTNFGSFNVGFGVDCFISKKMILFMDIETYEFGGFKGNGGGFVFPKNYYTTNTLINFGIKYNFKK